MDWETPTMFLRQQNQQQAVSSGLNTQIMQHVTEIVSRMGSTSIGMVLNIVQGPHCPISSANGTTIRRQRLRLFPRTWIKLPIAGPEPTFSCKPDHSWRSLPYSHEDTMKILCIPSWPSQLLEMPQTSRQVQVCRAVEAVAGAAVAGTCSRWGCCAMANDHGQTLNMMIDGYWSSINGWPFLVDGWWFLTMLMFWGASQVVSLL